MAFPLRQFQINLIDLYFSLLDAIIFAQRNILFSFQTKLHQKHFDQNLFNPQELKDPKH